jgi:hypothetical protein
MLEREADHTPPSCADVRSGCSYTFSPSVCLQVIYRDNFNFYKIICTSSVTDGVPDILHGFSWYLCMYVFICST